MRLASTVLSEPEPGTNAVDHNEAQRDLVVAGMVSAWHALLLARVEECLRTDRSGLSLEVDDLPTGWGTPRGRATWVLDVRATLRARSPSAAACVSS